MKINIEKTAKLTEVVIYKNKSDKTNTPIDSLTEKELEKAISMLGAAHYKLSIIKTNKRWD